ncbi:MAG: ribosome recycling factor [Oscillospiraceae bacterium]|nr:ribosome recycling factor [Oscillospiraceae bacterium]
MREQLIPYNEKMEKTLSVLAADYSSIRAGRANPGVLDRVNVEYYGSMTPVNQVAAVYVSEARILVIQPWDRSCLKLIEKAINASDIGIPPQNDGVCIRLVFPPLTEERRKDLCKTVSKHAEEAKVNVRNHRREANDFCKKQQKDKIITEDDLKDLEKDIQKMTDDFIARIEKMASEQNLQFSG